MSRERGRRLVARRRTKSGEPRTIDVTPQALDVLQDWYRESGGNDGLVFVREEGGRINCQYVLRHVLYQAMEGAGIPRIGERGRSRSFHSFRHTFARLALEAGAEITSGTAAGLRALLDHADRGHVRFVGQRG